MEVREQRKAIRLEKRSLTWKNIWKHREFYVLLIPAIVFAFIFQYIPMYGITMAFTGMRLFHH